MIGSSSIFGESSENFKQNTETSIDPEWEKLGEEWNTWGKDFDDEPSEQVCKERLE